MYVAGQSESRKTRQYCDRAKLDHKYPKAGFNEAASTLWKAPFQAIVLSDNMNMRESITIDAAMVRRHTIKYSCPCFGSHSSQKDTAATPRAIVNTDTASNNA